MKPGTLLRIKKKRYSNFDYASPGTGIVIKLIKDFHLAGGHGQQYWVLVRGRVLKWHSDNLRQMIETSHGSSSEKI